MFNSGIQTYERWKNLWKTPIVCTPYGLLLDESYERRLWLGCSRSLSQKSHMKWPNVMGYGLCHSPTSCVILRVEEEKRKHASAVSGDGLMHERCSTGCWRMSRVMTCVIHRLRVSVLLTKTGKGLVFVEHQPYLVKKCLSDQCALKPCFSARW